MISLIAFVAYGFLAALVGFWAGAGYGRHRAALEARKAEDAWQSRVLDAIRDDKP